VGESFLPGSPNTLFKKQQHNGVPIMTGIVENEGGLFYRAYRKYRDTMIEKSFLKRHFTDFVKNFTDFREKNINLVSAVLLREYFMHTDLKNESDVSRTMDTLVSDGTVNAAHDRFVRKLIKHGEHVYMYLLSHRGKNSLSRHYTDEDIGPIHADDLQYLFDTPPELFGPEPISGDDILTSHRMLTMWTNFAKTGDPTPSTTDEIPIKWEPVKSKDDINYLKIDKDLTMDSNFRVDKANTWNNYLPKIASGEKSLYKKDKKNEHVLKDEL
jgi:carboxylesterase type B